MLVLTHPDVDHYRWLERVVDDHPIARAIHSLRLEDYDVSGFHEWFPTHPARHPERGEDPDNVPRVEIESLPPRYHDPARSDRFDCGDVDVRILAANVPALRSGSAFVTNTPSIVLRLHRVVGGGSFSAILTGDATFDTEEAIMEWYPDDVLDVDLVRIAHHGSLDTSTSEAWLAATTPRIAVVSAGQHRRFRHPRCEVMDRVLGLGTLDAAPCHETLCGGSPDPACADGWCTSTCGVALYDSYSSGDITVEFDGQLRVTTERGAREDCGNE